MIGRGNGAQTFRPRASVDDDESGVQRSKSWVLKACSNLKDLGSWTFETRQLYEPPNEPCLEMYNDVSESAGASGQSIIILPVQCFARDCVCSYRTGPNQ